MPRRAFPYAFVLVGRMHASHEHWGWAQMLIGRMHVPNEHGGGTWVRIGRMQASKKHGGDAWVLVGRMGVSDKHRTGGKIDDCCHTGAVPHLPYSSYGRRMPSREIRRVLYAECGRS